MRTRVKVCAALAVGALAAGACSTDDGGIGSTTTGPPGSTLGVGRPPSTGGTPVIFSSDMAMGLTSGSANGTSSSPSDYDDSWALALAASSDELDVRGVVVTMGNNMVVPEMGAAQATADALDLDVPVVQGASTWLPMTPLQDYQGTDLDDACVNDGVEFLADELAASATEGDGVTIIAIGPLTDVACVIMNFPDAVGGIDEIVALIGAAPDDPLDFEGTTLRDFNYIMDPRALQVVLDESDVPFTAIMFGASSAAAISTTDVADLASSDDDLARFFGEASQPYAEFWAEQIAPEKPIWDANVVWYLLAPDAYTCELAGYQLQTGAPISGTDGAALSDQFSPTFTGTRQVTACNAFADQAAMDDFDAAVLAAVGGG